MATRPIEIDHLTKYYGTTRGVEDVSLAVEEGDVFGFIGPTGPARPRRSAPSST